MHKISSLPCSTTICVSATLPTTKTTTTTARTTSLLVLVILFHIQLNFLSSVHGDGCNEYVCGSVVSKCLLTQSCQCKLSDYYCCKDCLNCLGDLYTECCGCLDMCPKHNDTLSAMAPKSQIGDFDGVPELFETLTAEEDEDQWTTIRFPIRASLKRRFEFNSAGGGGGGGGGGGVASRNRGDAIDRAAKLHKLPSSINCTVIFLNSCTTNKKCAQYCESMGASSYRWFHDGCCECVGSDCINYGINESRCAVCPEEDDDDDDDESELDADYGGGENADMWDFGEDEINYN